jgi:hypothetical protein
MHPDRPVVNGYGNLMRRDAPAAEAASFGGVPPTAPGGLAGRLVSVATGQRRYLDRRDLAGTLALLNNAPSGPLAPMTVAAVTQLGAHPPRAVAPVRFAVLIGNLPVLARMHQPPLGGLLPGRRAWEWRCGGR